MKPHHRSSLLLGCLGLLVLYLPDGVRVAGSWPTRPELEVVPALSVSAAKVPVRGPLATPGLPFPEGPAPPVNVDQLVVEPSEASYGAGQ